MENSNVSKLAELARQDILGAIYAYSTMYGDFRLVAYKNCNPFHAEIVEIRAGRDAIAIEFEPDED